MADNRRPQDRAASPPVSVPPPSQAKPSAPLPRQEPVMRRWPRPAQQLPTAEEDPMQRYIRCSLSYQNQMLADIKALLERIALNTGNDPEDAEKG